MSIDQKLFHLYYLTHSFISFFFFFNDTATTEIYTLSLHDALPISGPPCSGSPPPDRQRPAPHLRSEEHTSELQSQSNLVCRLLLEKKKKTQSTLVCREKTNTQTKNRHRLLAY